MHPRKPRPDDVITPRVPARFAWRTCPEHPAPMMRPSVILAPDAVPWCVGDGDTIRGHPVELDREAAA